MKKILKKFVLLFVLVINAECAEASKDVVFLDRVVLSNSLATVLFDPLLPRNSVDVVTSKDNIVYYVAKIGVLNPSKRKYSVDIVCVDSKGTLILKGSVERTLSSFLYHVGGDVLRGVTQTLGLNPKPGAMVRDQVLPLEDGKDYYIKFYFEKKLLGITKFHYDVVK